jgi:NAD-dependent dihydropyrimidine dehydrogenase PreA subunit
VIREKFYTGGWIAGGFMGLVIGLTLLGQIVYRKNGDYQPYKGDCISCARCIPYCPVKSEIGK